MSAGRGTAAPTNQSANRSGNWAGRNGNWNGQRRWAGRRNFGPTVGFGFGTGYVDDAYAYENCGWVRVKRIIRHRVVLQRVWRCY
jgi:hypothetical protein